MSHDPIDLTLDDDDDEGVTYPSDLDAQGPRGPLQGNVASCPSAPPVHPAAPGGPLGAGSRAGAAAVQRLLGQNSTARKAPKAQSQRQAVAGGLPFSPIEDSTPAGAAASARDRPNVHDGDDAAGSRQLLLQPQLQPAPLPCISGSMSEALRALLKDTKLGKSQQQQQQQGYPLQPQNRPAHSGSLSDALKALLGPGAGGRQAAPRPLQQHPQHQQQQQQQGWRAEGCLQDAEQDEVLQPAGHPRGAGGVNVGAASGHAGQARASGSAGRASAATGSRRISEGRSAAPLAPALKQEACVIEVDDDGELFEDFGWLSQLGSGRQAVAGTSKGGHSAAQGQGDSPPGEAASACLPLPQSQQESAWGGGGGGGGAGARNGCAGGRPALQPLDVNLPRAPWGGGALLGGGGGPAWSGQGEARAGMGGGGRQKQGARGDGVQEESPPFGSASEGTPGTAKLKVWIREVWMLSCSCPDAVMVSVS